MSASTHDHDAHDADDHGGHHEHVTPLLHYFGVFGALMVLTAVTVWLSHFHFGVANTFIAMAVATLKASLVAMIFMHLLYDDRLNTLIFVFGLLFVSLFFIFTLADVMTRTYIDPSRDTLAKQKAEVAALKLEAEKARKAALPAPLSDEAAVPVAELPAPPAPATEAAPASAPEGAEQGAAPDGAEQGAAPAEGAAPADGEAAPASDGAEQAAPEKKEAAPASDAAPAP